MMEDQSGRDTTMSCDYRIENGTHSTNIATFEMFKLNPDLKMAISKCGFEQPTKVQEECIPKVCSGMDLLCEARNGIGKTMVYMVASLQALPSEKGGVSTIVICPTRELALQVGEQFKRVCQFLPEVKTQTFFGGLPISRDETILLENTPDIVIGTPGRLFELVKTRKLNLHQIKHFIIDECDEIFNNVSTRCTVQQIFVATPQEKQVMMFSATIPGETRLVCKKFMNEPFDFCIEDDIKSSLRGLEQYYISTEHSRKTRALLEYIGYWKFDQALIFVANSKKCDVLAHVLNKLEYYTVSIHKGMSQTERMDRYKGFIDAKKRILVTTNLFGRGMNNHRIDLVINYDIPQTVITYLHRVTRIRHFGDKAHVLSLVGSEKDATLLTQVQEKFDIDITEMARKSSISKRNMTSNGGNIPTTLASEEDDTNRQRSILWAEETMNTLCSELENINF